MGLVGGATCVQGARPANVPLGGFGCKPTVCVFMMLTHLCVQFQSDATGFATGHPRLARMADGQVLLSANQLAATDRDLLLYWNAAGDGKSWEPHSVSYWHNVLEPDPALHFTPAVNNSPALPRHGEITGLTCLIRTGAQAGIVVYSRTIDNASLTFAMPFTAPQAARVMPQP